MMLARRAEAETALQRALEIARRQQARWWELRAATSIARYWSDVGKPEEAYSLLQPVYSWFSDGFDTASLRDAQGLLADLTELLGEDQVAKIGAVEAPSDPALARIK